MEIGLSNSLTFSPFVITGIVPFDYGFSLVFVMGAVGYYCGAFVRVIRGGER